MPPYSGSDEIYRELVEESEESWLYGLTAFAIIEEQRIEWMRHFEQSRGELPGPDEVRGWYEQQPPTALLRAKGEAESALQTYSEEVNELVIEEQRREVEQGMIVGEIRSLKRFWPQFGMSLAGGFVGAMLFAALLGLFTFFVVSDTSPVEIARQLRNDTEAVEDGQE